jgi:drug/metabolite transporter (DMT)-like permease
MDAEPANAVVADARCAVHPDVQALASCHRCGGFVCEQDSRLIDARRYCLPCAGRPEVDYLEAFRLKYWGKRDSWAWFFGLGGLVNLMTAAALVITALQSQRAPPSMSALVTVLVTVLTGVTGVLFWLGRPIARPGLLVCLLLAGGAPLLEEGLNRAVGLGALLFPALIVASALASVRTKLFFKLDVPREKLRRAWDQLHNNTLAQQAPSVAVLGLLVPFVAPLAVVMGAIGLRRVDPSAHPPIGFKGRAIGGLVLGSLGTLFWLWVLYAAVDRRA